MENTLLLAVIQGRFPTVHEIPYPTAHAGAPAHEPKPYRDSTLYVSVPPDLWSGVAQFLKNEEKLSFDFLTFVTAVDYNKATAGEPARMDMVYHLYSLKYKHKCVIKVSLPRDNGRVDSVASLWHAADWQEREVYDMFGIQFRNHPNLKRILMWEGFPGWPMRKDYVHIPDRYDD
ncbi:MAG: NADH-quinone oxidoreductase subunit C [Elusimicrobia bacterium]|nr:NADH-quinone oxidoreductase subunit C [Elusimicrobiota bacterium]MBI2916074.1 NADH-quinone oxidoreductase subunit C [Elusimicrobiota bacterium]